MATSFMIVGVNFVLKVMLVELIKSLRLKTVTLETIYTMVSVFVGQFANTAILQVMNNANLSDFDGGTGFLSVLFPVGTMTDFNMEWYATVGTLLMRAMMMAAIWPLIEFAMFYSLITFTRCVDKNFGSDPMWSRSPSVQAYIDTWAGPIYLIHYRYATILLAITVAFVYGTGMPMLYFYAFLAYLVLYINERLLVCYYYREPPTFDEQMTLLCLDLIKWVPYLMLPFCFWMLGNRQIYETVTFPIDFKSDVRLSGHTISTAITHLDPRLLTYNSAPMWLFIVLVTYSIVSWLFCSADDEEEDDGLVEGLEDYYTALKKDDKAMTIGQEETMLNQYRVKTFSDEQFLAIKNAGDADLEKIIMGVATYRILESMAYQQLFQYEPSKKDDHGEVKRDGVIVVSTQEDCDPKHIVNEPLQQDATYLVVNLPFIPENKRRTLNLDTSGGKSLF